MVHRILLGAVLALSACTSTAQPLKVELLPPSARPGAPLPTVIALHGRGSDAATFARFVQRLAPQARIISLQAPAPLGRGFTWFESRVAAPDQLRLGAQVRAALEGLRPRLAALVARDDGCGRPLLLGYSQGGVLTLALVAERFSGVGAFVDLSGTLPEGYPVKSGADSAPVLSLHGTDDPFVPIGSTRIALQRLCKSGVPVTTIELPGGHDPTPQLRAEVTARLLPLLKAQCPAAFKEPDPAGSPAHAAPAESLRPDAGG